MTKELAEILRRIVAALYREAGQEWAREMIEDIDKELAKSLKEKKKDA
jgi:hypothetical protein